MKKTLVLVLLALLVSSLFSYFDYSGEFRTRYSWLRDWFDSPNLSDRFIDSRLQAQFQATPINNLRVVFGVQVGDLTWGDDAETGIFSKHINIRTQHLYAAFTGIERTEIQMGLLPWNDMQSLVFDEDFAGVFFRHEFCNYVTLETGYGLLRNGESVLHSNWYGPLSHQYSSNADNALYFVNVEYEKEVGIQTLVNTYKYGPGRNRAYHAWAMPYINKEFGRLAMSTVLAYNFGFIDRDSDFKNTVNHGLGFSLDLELDAGRGGKPGVNLLITTGDNGDDPESTTYFATISSDYQNGLELLGNGVHDGSPRDYWFDPFNGGHGILSAVARYSLPLCPKTTLRFAVGTMSAIEEGGREGTLMGTEVNLGVQFNLLRDLSIDVIGAYAMPDAFFGKDLENVIGVHGKLNINF